MGGITESGDPRRESEADETKAQGPALKSELGERSASPTEARHELFDDVEVFYNQRRRHSSLGYLSPGDFEHRYTARSAMTAA